MTLEMTEKEIQRRYSEAKNKAKQLKILAQLNNCTVEDIRAVVGLGKPEAESESRADSRQNVRHLPYEPQIYSMDAVVSKVQAPASECSSAGQEMERLTGWIYRKLDELDRQIGELVGQVKELEALYQKYTNALDVYGEYGRKSNEK